MKIVSSYRLSDFIVSGWDFKITISVLGNNMSLSQGEIETINSFSPSEIETIRTQ